MDIRKVFKNLDYSILASVGLLVTIGLAMVYSATHLKIQGNSYYFFFRQCIAVVIGVGGAIAFLCFDYRISDRVSHFLYGINIFLLLLVLSPLGRVVNGARSWLFFFQPSEISKIITIITLAKYLGEKESFHSFYDLIGPFIYVGIPVVLIMLQPNLGTALVFIFFLFMMLLVAGAPGRKLLMIILAVTLGLTVMFLGHHYYHTPLPVKQYQIERLTSFTHPEHDLTGTGWQLNQAMIAVGSGQFSGKGYLKGTQGRLGYLPEAHTDFIFSVLAEEWGFIGCFTVLFLYFTIIWRGIRIANMAKDKVGCLTAVGIAMMLLFHVLENVGMNMGIMPVAGIPLPFISFGGTAMVINLTAIGILMNIWVRHHKIMF